MLTEMINLQAETVIILSGDNYGKFRSKKITQY
jgi:hypothetical protein